MHDDNRVVQGLWVGGRLSALERLCVRSFCAHGHEFHLYHYDELHNVPQVHGLRLMNAADIVPRETVFTPRRGRISILSDLFRWELLARKGGWWADMDIVCLRPFDFPESVVFGGGSIQKDLNSAVLKFPPRHAFAKLMADCYANPNRVCAWDDKRIKAKKFRRRLAFWRDPRVHLSIGEAGGAGGFGNAIKHLGLAKHAQPTHVFYLLDLNLLEYAFKDAFAEIGGLAALFSQSHAIHFLNTHLNAAGVNKDGNYPTNSLYEVLKRRYGEAKQ